MSFHSGLVDCFLSGLLDSSTSIIWTSSPSRVALFRFLPVRSRFSWSRARAQPFLEPGGESRLTWLVMVLLHLLEELLGDGDHVPVLFIIPGFELHCLVYELLALLGVGGPEDGPEEVFLGEVNPKTPKIELFKAV